MSNHTPGPWKVSVGDIFYVIDENETIIADTLQYVEKGRERANAHLIAAAPEMLEALEIVFDVIEGAEGPTRTLSGKLIRWENIVETVQNAIAKANYEGRSQS